MLGLHWSSFITQRSIGYLRFETGGLDISPRSSRRQISIYESAVIDLAWSKGNRKDAGPREKSVGYLEKRIHRSEARANLNNPPVFQQTLEKPHEARSSPQAWQHYIQVFDERTNERTRYVACLFCFPASGIGISVELCRVAGRRCLSRTNCCLFWVRCLLPESVARSFLVS